MSGFNYKCAFLESVDGLETFLGASHAIRNDHPLDTILALYKLNHRFLVIKISILSMIKFS